LAPCGFAKHITSGQGSEAKDAAREKAREEAIKKLEEASAKKNEPPKPLPDLGSPEDFQLQQAVAHLKGKPVLVSKTMTERKPEDTKAQ
jgi:carboxyl-terminal processing protease